MKKILLVEDELPYLKILNDQLTQEGYQVLEAKNGQEGLTIAKSEHPDLLIIDIKMPVMDGLTMLDELRKDDSGKSADVILLTNLEANGKITEKILEDQPTYYFVKSDIELTELMEKIKNILSV